MALVAVCAMERGQQARFSARRPARLVAPTHAYGTGDWEACHAADGGASGMSAACPTNGCQGRGKASRRSLKLEAAGPLTHTRLHRETREVVAPGNAGVAGEPRCTGPGRVAGVAHPAALAAVSHQRPLGFHSTHQVAVAHVVCGESRVGVVAWLPLPPAGQLIMALLSTSQHLNIIVNSTPPLCLAMPAHTTSPLAANFTVSHLA